MILSPCSIYLLLDGSVSSLVCFRSDLRQSFNQPWVAAFSLLHIDLMAFDTLKPPDGMPNTLEHERGLEIRKERRDGVEKRREGVENSLLSSISSNHLIGPFYRYLIGSNTLKQKTSIKAHPHLNFFFILSHKIIEKTQIGMDRDKVVVTQTNPPLIQIQTLQIRIQIQI